MAANAAGEPAEAPDLTKDALTQREDEWYSSVYRPNEVQFTARSVIFGCIIGSVMSAANLYTGFTAGWTFGASITSAISAWVIFKLWTAATRGPHFTVLENNTMQTASSAAAAMASAGLVNAVPALMIMTGRRLSILELTAWVMSVAFLGICFAIPLKRQMINVENLRFPEGIAAAEATQALHGEGAGGKDKAIALFSSGGLAAAVCFCRDLWEKIPAGVPAAGPLISTHTFGQLTLQLNPNMLFLGAGALIGVRICLWMAVGATVCWAVLMPWVADHQFVPIAADLPSYFARGAKWCMWPGVTMLVVSGILSFVLKAKDIVRAIQSFKTLKAAVEEGTAREDVEVPMAWFYRAFAAAALVCMVTQYFVFEMPFWQTALAIALSSVLALVGTRAQGETNVNPIGAMGKVTQLLFAIVAPGNAQANLMAAGITSAGSNSCGDIMQDMKTGRLLGASPRKQFFAQLFGIGVGGIATVVVFVLAFPVEKLGTAKYPAPAVQTWKNMAELLTKGISNLPPHTVTAMAIAAALAAVFTVVGELAPQKLRMWVPSATGLGLSFILPASNSYTFLLGGVIAWVIAKKWPKKDELYTVATASGLIAGESVMGVAIALYLALKGG
jgi:putative OPT family oligopeptide transporter